MKHTESPEASTRSILSTAYRHANKRRAFDSVWIGERLKRAGCCTQVEIDSNMLPTLLADGNSNWYACNETEESS